MGDREQYLLDAIRLLDEHESIDAEAISSFYETDPVGYTDQEAFLNMVVSVRTELAVEQLFAYMEQVEKQLGRQRLVRWGPRTLDLDLLAYGDLKLNTEKLEIPHPRMHERAFVLIPLLEVMKKQHKNTESLETQLETLDGKDGVRLWKRML